MTANHAHTPTWDRVREHYYLGRQQFDDPLFPAGGVTEIVAEFDRWYQAEIAAAEQRGADKTRVIIARKLKAEDPEAQVHLANVGSNIYAWLWVAAQKDYIEQELSTFQNFPDRLEGDDD